ASEGPLSDVGEPTPKRDKMMDFVSFTCAAFSRVDLSHAARRIARRGISGRAAATRCRLLSLRPREHRLRLFAARVGERTRYRALPGRARTQTSRHSRSVHVSVLFRS